MENNIESHKEDPHKGAKPIEHDYSAHENDPGPSPEAVNEDDKDGAGKAMKWIIPIVIILLFIIYWIMF
ncbi:hypothetical protein [Pedobacter sp.]|uniref:hypothetical protein n=1 Tax=Pedobacter sp. TaxID=1411316 RepID=UPI003D7FB772